MARLVLQQRKKNPAAGWLCAQPRFGYAFVKLFKLYQDNKHFPDYLVLADDDLHQDMKSFTTNEYLISPHFSVGAKTGRHTDPGLPGARNEVLCPLRFVFGIFCRLHNRTGIVAGEALWRFDDFMGHVPEAQFHIVSYRARFIECSTSTR
jgi:hypothetical protein